MGGGEGEKGGGEGKRKKNKPETKTTIQKNPQINRPIHSMSQAKD